MRTAWSIAACLLVLPIAGAQRAGSAEEKTPWQKELKKAIESLDESTPGELGVYVKRLDDGRELKYEADRKWYLASTVKIPVAIALLQEVEKGAISLDQKLELKKSDFVDGTGEILWSDPGKRFTVAKLLEEMLTESDSTAADMLIRLIGVQKLNDRVRTMSEPGSFNPITTLLQVRADAYSELHPRARELTNMDFIDFKKSKGLDERLNRFLSRLGLRKDDLESGTIEEAFERYYEKEVNSATLDGFGKLLEKLQAGELLNQRHTKLVLGYMSRMVTGEKRIKAGLPPSVSFAQKTGTQIRRICNVGILNNRKTPGRHAVVTACLEKFEDQDEAEKALSRLGELIVKTGTV